MNNFEEVFSRVDECLDIILKDGYILVKGYDKDIYNDLAYIAKTKNIWFWSIVIDGKSYMCDVSRVNALGKDFGDTVKKFIKEKERAKLIENRESILSDLGI